MAFDVFPSELELSSFFETGPELLKDTVLTYKRAYQDETLFCSFSPDYGDIDLTLLHLDKQKLVLSLSHVHQVQVLQHAGREQLKVSFQPGTLLRNFLLVVKPEVTIIWGTTLGN